MIKYGDTKQLRDIIRQVTTLTRYEGKTAEGESIYNTNPLPTLTFRGSIKLHGTNAGISHYPDDSLVKMSRNNVKTDGHFGFPEMINQEEVEIRSMIAEIRSNPEVKADDIVSVYGEWAGPGVQKGVAISQIPTKTWFIFAVKLTNAEGEGRWLEDIISLTCDSERVYNIHSFGTYNVIIDFSNPSLIQNYLVEITNNIEVECPIAKQLGNVSGVGEGVVWETWYKGRRVNFKVKGSKHSVSKTTTLAPINPEKAKSIDDFLNYAITINRIDQAMFEIAQELEIDQSELSRRNTGSILEWVKQDIIKEESQVMRSSNLEWRDINRRGSDRIRQYYFDKLSVL